MLTKTGQSVVVLTMLVVLAGTGCSEDPTTSEAYASLEQELAEATAQLDVVTAERDALAAENDELASRAESLASTSAIGELPVEALEVYEDYTAALLAADGEAMLGFVTDDFTWLSYGTNLMTAEERAPYVSRYYGGFEVAEIGGRTVVGDGDEYIFSVPERATTPMVADGISLVKLVKVGDVWLVAAHRFLGEGEGSA